MSNVIECDGCGDIVKRETLSFTIQASAQLAGGDFMNPQGTRFDWDHPTFQGDLCGECAQDVMPVLNEVLQNSSQE